MFGVLVIDEPALMEKWMDRLVAEEWPAFHAETREARAIINREVAEALNDADAHKRLLTGLEGCLFAALVQPLRDADLAALVKLHRAHENALRKARAATKCLRLLQPIARSANLTAQLAALVEAIEREFAGPPVGPDYGKHMTLLLQLERERPGRIAELVAAGRLAEEYGSEFERVAMKHVPFIVVTTASGKRIEKVQLRRGRKGYGRIAMNVTVMANIIQYTAWGQDRDVTRYGAHKLLGTLLAAYLPREHRGAVHVNAMYDKDRESARLGLQVADKSELLGK